MEDEKEPVTGRAERGAFQAENSAYAKVLCQIKAWRVGEMKGQGAWEGVA